MVLKAKENLSRAGCRFWMAVNTAEHKRQHKCQPLQPLPVCKLERTKPGCYLSLRWPRALLQKSTGSLWQGDRHPGRSAVRGSPGSSNGARQKPYSAKLRQGFDKRNSTLNDFTALCFPLGFSSYTAADGAVRGDTQPNVSISSNPVSPALAMEPLIIYIKPYITQSPYLNGLSGKESTT